MAQVPRGLRTGVLRVTVVPAGGAAVEGIPGSDVLHRFVEGADGRVGGDAHWSEGVLAVGGERGDG